MEWYTTWQGAQNTSHWRVIANDLPSVHYDRFYTDHTQELDALLPGCVSLTDVYAPYGEYIAPSFNAVALDGNFSTLIDKKS